MLCELELEPVLGLLDDELLHAAATTARLAAIDAQAIALGTWCKVTTHFVLWPVEAAIHWRRTAEIPQRLLLV
jgi:hypothetical protein